MTDEAKPVDLDELRRLEWELKLSMAQYVSYEGPTATGHKASVCLGDPRGEDHSCLADIFGATEAEACDRARAVAAFLASVSAMADELTRLRLEHAAATGLLKAVNGGVEAALRERREIAARTLRWAATRYNNSYWPETALLALADRVESGEVTVP